MATAGKRPKAVFHFRKVRALGNFIIKAQGVVAQMEDHTHLFPSPTPALAVVKAHIKDLFDAQTVVETRVIGSAAARDVKYNIVCRDIHGLLNYVQRLADISGNENAATTIITASGFSVKGTNMFTKEPLRAKNTGIQGQVLLLAKAAAKRASYRWQQSADQVNWLELPVTIKAKATVNNMPRGINYFRYCSVTKTGQSNWSTPVSVVVQ